MKTARWSVWVLVFLAVAPLARPTTMIYPVEAIDDLWTLGADDFRQRYAGINISGLGPSDEGWYVRYRHANLTYLFGPLADREAARAKKWDMEAVRDAAIRNRQTLTSSSVDFVRFTYSGVFGRGGDGPGGGKGPPRISADGRSGPDGDLDGDGIPNSLDDDMDGDGIPNAQDPDIDGDGISNESDDYMYGSNPAEGNGADGNAAGGGQKAGQSGSDGDKVAGKEGNSQGADGTGSEKGGAMGQQGAGQNGQKQGASNQQGSRGSRVAQQGGQSGQQGRQSGQQGQSGQQSQSGQSGQQSQSSSSSSSGSPSSGQQGPPSGSSGASGNPLSLVAALLRMILGL